MPRDTNVQNPQMISQDVIEVGESITKQYSLSALVGRKLILQSEIQKIDSILTLAQTLNMTVPTPNG